MANGDNLLDEVKNLNEGGKLSPEAIASLSLAALSDVLIVVREGKNDNVDIKNCKSLTCFNYDKQCNACSSKW